jgi:hypothetical protein
VQTTAAQATSNSCTDFASRETKATPINCQGPPAVSRPNPPSKHPNASPPPEPDAPLPHSAAHRSHSAEKTPATKAACTNEEQQRNANSRRSSYHKTQARQEKGHPPPGSQGNPSKIHAKLNLEVQAAVNQCIEQANCLTWTARIEEPSAGMICLQIGNCIAASEKCLFGYSSCTAQNSALGCDKCVRARKSRNWGKRPFLYLNPSSEVQERLFLSKRPGLAMKTKSSAVKTPRTPSLPRRRSLSLFPPINIMSRLSGRKPSPGQPGSSPGAAQHQPRSSPEAAQSSSAAAQSSPGAAQSNPEVVQEQQRSSPGPAQSIPAAAQEQPKSSPGTDKKQFRSSSEAYIYIYIIHQNFHIFGTAARHQR